eukprot:TRINITY_DN9594_c0_g1_i1.p2 TRINITY_DN9594_c0_g1~~TRINITY_DN9594_c0_g1_i1.p2  ORF type:complete len:127 (-),score=14.90 TRINITY_DN9594_c0_g1_i1:132-512(-)
MNVISKIEEYQKYILFSHKTNEANNPIDQIFNFITLIYFAKILQSGQICIKGKSKKQNQQKNLQFSNIPVKTAHTSCNEGSQQLGKNSFQQHSFMKSKLPTIQQEMPINITSETIKAIQNLSLIHI